MAKSILGIDPGLTGAWAFYQPERGAAYVDDMPVSGSSTTKQIEALLLLQALQGLNGLSPIVAAAVEKVGPMPTDGCVQAFKFGAAYGEVKGVVKTLLVPLYEPTPATWKRHFGLIGKDKEASRQLAIHRFPQAAHHLKRKKDQGRAEALLIAAWLAETQSHLWRPVAAVAA